MLQSNIVFSTHLNSILCSCGSRWSEKKFVYRTEIYRGEICGICDNYYQPFLSNPKNKELVEKYIHIKYHKYIFQEYKWFYEYDRVVREFKKKSTLIINHMTNYIETNS